MLNKGSDIYCFGFRLMEHVSGRSPVNYSRRPRQVNLVEWFKGMADSKHGEEVLDPQIEVLPSPRALKHVLLVCLHCLENRPKMGQTAHMLEGDEFPFRIEHRSPRGGSLTSGASSTTAGWILHPPGNVRNVDSERSIWR